MRPRAEPAYFKASTPLGAGHETKRHSLVCAQHGTVRGAVVMLGPLTGHSGTGSHTL